jgi:hypothetical protein
VKASEKAIVATLGTGVVAGGLFLFISSRKKKKNGTQARGQLPPVAPPIEEDGEEVEEPTAGVIIAPERPGDRPRVVTPPVSVPLPGGGRVEVPSVTIPPVEFGPPPPPEEDEEEEEPEDEDLPEDEDEDEDEDEEPIARSPGFVPPPISNAPTPAPAPPINVPTPRVPDFIPTPVVGPGIPIEIPRATRPVTPPVIEVPSIDDVEQESTVPEDTARVVRKMLAAEASSGWKKVEPELKIWQRARGRSVDGKFGPGDAIAMAAEIGTLPIIRFWPAGTLPPGAVEDFQEKLFELAAEAEEPRASQLRASADREQGQGFGSNQTTISPLIELEDLGSVVTS